MGKYASKVVKLAQSWIGKNESDGSHKEIIDIYNGHTPLARGYKLKYTDYWCAGTISALAIKLGYTDIIPTECGCGEMIKLFQKLGCWVEDDAYTPKAGDIIFYDWQDSGIGDNKGWSDHVGVVEKVSGDTITVIEGNYNKRVQRREIKVNAKYIRGYGVPKYDAEPVANPSPSVLYRVQVGAYTKKANADRQLQRVKEAGFDTYMVKVGKYYKIQVGAYSKKSNADAMLAKVKKAGFSAFITKTVS